ncbi:MAG: efflux RND transporter periplasmic adaptor subunit [Bacteroidales bacterium]|nr:efflux RND transporter periplasmic adaptor subunit [Bacteroidales bacterium]
MKIKLIIPALLFILITGCNNQDPGLEADVEIPVSVDDIKLKSIEEYINTTGTVYPVVDVELKSEIPARYYLEENPATGRKWELGDRVSKGSLIARLEDEEYENNVKLELHELNLELAKSKLEKQESLYEKGGVTLNDLKQSGYDYANAQISVKNARIQMEKMNITSPFDAVITGLPYYTQGSEIETGKTIAGLMDYKKMMLDINLPERYINDISTGKEVRITNYALPGDTLNGRISQLSPAINPETRTFKGKIEINNPGLKLRPGMFVKADIITSRADSAIVIPKDIILSRQRGMTVFVVEKGVARERVIQTGLENNESVQVLRGLEPNERVVSDGFETLSHNARVKILK